MHFGYLLTPCIPTILLFPRTAVKLVKEIVTAGQEEMPEGTIYSIALLQNGAPTVQSAHEKTKSMLRDMVLGDEQEEAGALDTDMLTDDVQPDERIQELLSRSDYDAMRLKRIAATLPKGVEPDLNGGGGFGGASKPAFKKKPAPARKATSAASFFGASSSASTASKSGGSSKPPTSSKPKPTNKLGFASAGSSSAPKKKAAEVGKENSENEDAMAVDEAPIAKKKAAPIAKKKASSPKDKKKSQSSSKANSPNRGNVDDFVGDEDEDEDFLESEAQRQARKAKDAKAAEDKLAEQKKKQAPANRRKVIQDDDDDDDVMDVDKKEKEAVYGEMDFHFNKGDDAANNAAGGGKKEKKKRRKLVEKTSMDDRGFLITEKVWVEEDIPTDEEDNAEEAGPSPTKKLKSAFGGAAAAPGAAKKKKPAVKNTKGMKQAGLGSFFGAKKK